MLANSKQVGVAKLILKQRKNQVLKKGAATDREHYSDCKKEDGEILSG